MRIHSLTIKENGNHQRVSAFLDHREIWFRIPADFDIDAADASAFLVVSIVPAMALGEDITVEKGLYVSQRLLDSLPSIHEIYSCWNPLFKAVSVTAEAKISPTRSIKTGSFFSGGVDGTYTLLTHHERIDDLILINGFDFSMDGNTWSAMVSRNQDTANALGKRLVPVETNLKSFTLDHGLARLANYGSVLASVAILMGYRTALVSGSETYRSVHRSGAHPLLDPLWSTEATQLLHLGLEADRAKKMLTISQHATALKHLWVCWQHPSSNCGKCSKCLRTSIAMDIIGAPAEIFAHRPTVDDYKTITIRNPEDAGFYEGFLELAVQNNCKELSALLLNRLNAYKLRQLLVSIKQHVLSKLVNRLRMGRAREENNFTYLTIYPRDTETRRLQYTRDYVATHETLEDKEPVGTIF